MRAECGNYECYFNDSQEPTGLYRCGTRIGSVLYVEDLWVVAAKDFVGCHKNSLQAALDQWFQIRKVLGSSEDDCSE